MPVPSGARSATHPSAYTCRRRGTRPILGSREHRCGVHHRRQKICRNRARQGVPFSGGCQICARVARDGEVPGRRRADLCAAPYVYPSKEPIRGHGREWVSHDSTECDVLRHGKEATNPMPSRSPGSSCSSLSTSTCGIRTRMRDTSGSCHDHASGRSAST